MKALFSIILMLATLIGCAQASQKQQSNFSKAILGTWFSNEANADGSQTYFEKTYKSDGTAEGFLIDAVSDSLGNKKILSRLEFKSHWHIENDMLIITDVIYSDGSNNKKITDKIIEINKEKSILQSIDTGETLVRYRKNKLTKWSYQILQSKFNVQQEEFDVLFVPSFETNVNPGY